RGVALALAASGANVVLAARRADLIEELAAKIIETGGNSLAVTTDVSREEDVARLAAAAVDRFGQVDVWVNNVGVGALGFFWDVPARDHARIVDVNLKGLVFGACEALARFAPRASARSSTSARSTARCRSPTRPPMPPPRRRCAASAAH